MSKAFDDILQDKTNFQAIEITSNNIVAQKNIDSDMLLCAANLVNVLNRIEYRYYTVILYVNVFDGAANRSKYHIIITE